MNLGWIIFCMILGSGMGFCLWSAFNGERVFQIMICITFAIHCADWHYGRLYDSAFYAFIKGLMS